MGSHPASSHPATAASASAAAGIAPAPLPQAAIMLARRLVMASGGRNTGARRNVLACLIASDRALSHADIELQLSDSGLDRVTLYRVLDWLVEHSLAHRVGTAGGVAGVERAMRFAFTRPEKPHSHAHFQCTQCGRTICLDDVAAPALAVPPGIELQGIELAAFGRCAHCRAEAGAGGG